jgi:hypothetical protein
MSAGALGYWYSYLPDLKDAAWQFEMASWEYENWLWRDHAWCEPSDLGGVRRSGERAATWLQEFTFYEARRSEFRRVLVACFWRCCDVARAAAVIRQVASELFAASGTEPWPSYDASDRRGNLPTPRRRGPEIIHGKMPSPTLAMIEAINRAHERDRWHVALRLLLSQAIHVTQHNRPSAFEIVEKARELSGEPFPDGPLDTSLAKFAGVRLGYLTDKPRGGRGKRSIESVVSMLRRLHVPSDEALVREVIRANPGIAGDEEIAKQLAPIRRQRVTAARRALVAAGEIENRGTDRRPRLFVRN